MSKINRRTHLRNPQRKPKSNQFRSFPATLDNHESRRQWEVSFWSTPRFGMRWTHLSNLCRVHLWRIALSGIALCGSVLLVPPNAHLSLRRQHRSKALRPCEILAESQDTWSYALRRKSPKYKGCWLECDWRRCRLVLSLRHGHKQGARKVFSFINFSIFQNRLGNFFVPLGFLSIGFVLSWTIFTGTTFA